MIQGLIEEKERLLKELENARALKYRSGTPHSGFTDEGGSSWNDGWGLNWINGEVLCRYSANERGAAGGDCEIPGADAGHREGLATAIGSSTTGNGGTSHVACHTRSYPMVPWAVFLLQAIQKKEKQQEEEERNMPHLSNLNEDPALVGKLKHMLKPGKSNLGLKWVTHHTADSCILQTGEFIVGNAKDGTCPGVVLNGPR